MADTTDAKATPALLYAVMLEISKHMAAQAHKSDEMVRELKQLREFFVREFDHEEPAQAPASSNASSSPPAGGVQQSAPAPASGLGFDAILEEMIAEELGIDPAALRSGNIDKEVVRKLIRDAKAKKAAQANGAGASSTT